MSSIKFRFSPEKAFTALHWMLTQRHEIEIHAALKACYFADKDHLNQHARPIFGATYQAMRFGPVPLEIYEMAKGEALWMAELFVDSLPWEMRGYRLRLVGNQDPSMASLSSSDEKALKEGLGRSLSMTFSERTAATHGKDWQQAKLGIMRYEDMLDEGPNKKEIIEHLRENARFMRL